MDTSKYIYIQNVARRESLDTRIQDRIEPTTKLEMTFDPRPVHTRRVVMPIVDCRKPNKVPMEKTFLYDPEIIFNPGSSAPNFGYANNIDKESRMRNIFFPLQKAGQSKYIPDSKSDLYDNNYLAQHSKQVEMKHNLLFERTYFPSGHNANINLGNDMFNNHTRQQTKNLKQ
jgi:hypothetical protein|uniref:Uncharacterized protein n=1 Tax=viral metagenome TaxID=1070528 RepID=A0A6C0AKV4_9ZZZZ